MESRVNIDHIIFKCEFVLLKYSHMCHTFPAGDEGIKRKSEFAALISLFHNKLDPVLALNEIYEFHLRHKKSSRLNIGIRIMLTELLGIKPPLFYGSRAKIHEYFLEKLPSKMATLIKHLKENAGYHEKYIALKPY